MDKKIGFIGAGNMGGALIHGLTDSGVPKDRIYVYDAYAPKLDEYAKEGYNTCRDEKSLAGECDIVVLAVKPNVFESALKPLHGMTKPLYISIAAGITIDFAVKCLGEGSKVVRVMPNTPAMIGEGMTGVSAGPGVSDEQVQSALEIFNSVGLANQVPEKLMDAVVGVSGSGPAYVYMFIEAMADAAVQQGMPRDLAYRFAAQTVKGSAQMVLSTGEHPGKLKDNVCSPGGTTIDAVTVLEADGLRNAVMDAVAAASEKSKQLTK